jgi:hypothetical protein
MHTLRVWSATVILAHWSFSHLRILVALLRCCYAIYWLQVNMMFKSLKLIALVLFFRSASRVLYISMICTVNQLVMVP